MTRLPPAPPLLAALLLGSAALPARAQCDGAPLEELVPAAATGRDNFGWSVGVDGPVAAMGAPDAAPAGVITGVVSVYRHDGLAWQEEAQLLPKGIQPRDQFGWAVAVSGNVVAVGETGDDSRGNDAGSVVVFRYDGTKWVEEQELTASDGAASDSFGHAVAVSGNLLVAAAVYDDANGILSGSAYVFRFDGVQWVEEAKLTAGDGQPLDLFGQDVDIDGDLIVVGAWQHDHAGLDSGAAYVFREAGGAWLEEQELLAADAAPADQLGAAVAVSAGRVLVGAWLDDDNGTNSGSAYVFLDSGGAWTEEQKLLAGDGAIGDQFGRALDLDGGTIVVGAHFADERGNDAGAAYSYGLVAGQWVEGPKLLAGDGMPLDELGATVAVSGEVALVGAPLHDQPQGVDAGAVYAFLVNGLILEANQNDFGPGDSLLLRTCAGQPLTPRLLAVVQVNGTPAFLRVEVGLLDAAGQRDFGGIVPPGLGGLVARFAALGFTPALRLDLSNVQELTFR